MRVSGTLFLPILSQLKPIFHHEEKPLTSSTQWGVSTLLPILSLGRVFTCARRFQPSLGRLLVPSTPPSSLPASIVARCCVSEEWTEPGSKKGRATSLLELHVHSLLPQPLGTMPLLPPHCPSGSSSHLPRPQLLPPLHLGRMSFLCLPPQEPSGREAAYGPILLGLGRLFGKEKPTCPVLLSGEHPPSPLHIPQKFSD